MNTDTFEAAALAAWRGFLQQQGAAIEDGEVRHYGDAAAERRASRDRDVLVDLSHLSLVQASGADTVTFLNGQLTCDVRQATSDRSLLGAWCSPKGRMLALFRVLRRGDAYLLQLPASLSADVLKRLRMYVLRSKVTLEPADDAFVRLGVAGPTAASLVQAAVGVAPDADGGVATAAGGAMVLGLPGFHPRFEILAPPEQAQSLWSNLKRNALPVGAAAWTWHDIVAGIPTVLPPTSDAFLPQMANLDLLGGISFDKGCYVGQEIVARVHYRGRLKQRMYRLHAETDVTPAPGASLYATGAPEQASGTVVVAVPAPETGQDLLAVIYTDRAGAELHLERADGPRLRVERLPYEVALPE